MAAIVPRIPRFASDVRRFQEVVKTTMEMTSVVR
jgi:hypothetical protein